VARAADPAGLRRTVVVLAGGRGARLGGANKPQLLLAGRSLLDHVLDAVPSAAAVVVVGPEQPTARPVWFCREEPAYGGPVAALSAALPLVASPAFGLVAADMPRAGGYLVELMARWSGEEALIPVDASGRRQSLCSVLDATAVRRALTLLGPPAGRSLRDLMALLSVTEVPVDQARIAALADVDEPADLAALDAAPVHRHGG
jgi:molybdopterin-guanine dinucleotide biosynthesis protein A